MKIPALLLRNETVAAALAGAAGFAVWALFIAVLATRLQMPVWT